MLPSGEALSLYTADEITSAVEAAPRRAIDKACTACALHASVHSVCLPAEGDAGGLYIVSPYPGAQEDKAGRVYWGQTGRYIRALAQRWTRGGVVAYDNAVRCFPGRNELKPAHVAACRPYLHEALAQVRPKRVIALGSVAVQGLLGRAVNPQAVLGGYGWLGDRGVPVFILPHPMHLLRNRLLRAQWEDAFEHAITCDDPPQPPWDGVAWMVRTEADARAAVAVMRAAPWTAYDFETTGELFGHGDLRAILLSATPKGCDDAFVWDEAALRTPATWRPLREWFEDASALKVAQNEKFDRLIAVEALGVEVRGLHGDTRLWRKLLDAGVAADLDTMSELVGMGGVKSRVDPLVAAAVRKLRKEDKDDGLAPRDNPKAYAYERFPPDTLARYGATDTVSTARLGAKLEADLIAVPDLHATWERTVRDASVALAQIERWGAPADRRAMETFSTYLRTQIAPVEARLKRAAGSDDFNPGSSQQVAALLYGRLRLPVAKTTDGGAPSTDEQALSKLKGKHRVVDDLLEYRRLSKLDSTYAAGMLSHVRPDGRIHTTYLLDGTGTGRMSSAAPNLQNIPRPETDEGVMARNVFAAPIGSRLTQGDFSQLELRIAAMLSGDERMIDIFRSGVDYHWRTAQLIAPKVWGKRPEDVAAKGLERSRAKVVNFRLLYGSTDYGLSLELGCTVEEAAAIRAAIFGTFPRLAQWVQDCLAETRRTGYAWTWWDGRRARRRPLWGIADTDDGIRKNAENSSFNTPAQGTASEFCVMSLIELVRWIQEESVPAKVVLTVHDSIVVESPEEDQPEIAWQMRRIMEGWPSGDVPLKVDLEEGQAWGSMRSYKIAA